MSETISIGKELEKNISKYNSYRSSIEQIDLAISSRFFLEAITIEESILADRLLRLCRQHNFNVAANRVTLGGELKFLREKQNLIIDNKIVFFPDLEEFWKNRNICLHQIAKSEPGEPTFDYEQLIISAEKTALLGKRLVKTVSNWAASIKTKNAAK